MIQGGERMELYQLRSFVMVAAENHLTRAAEKLNLSQPSVSAHIKALEQEMELALFNRTPAGMQLTSEGKRLCRQAEKILAEVESMVRMGSSLQGRPAGVIRIGLNRHADFLRITPLYQRLHSQFPGIEVILQQSISGTIIKLIRAGQLDCGFIFGGCDYAAIELLQLACYRLRVVGPAPFREQLESADLTGLADFPWIGIPDDCPYSPIMEKYFYSRGLRLQTGVVADQQSAILSMIESGAGLSFMLEEEAYPAMEEGRVAIWPGGSFPIDLSFACRAGEQPSAVVESVKEVIRSIWLQESDGSPITAVSG